jgi:uncharacterized protein (DUF983 family)
MYFPTLWKKLRLSASRDLSRLVTLQAFLFSLIDEHTTKSDLNVYVCRLKVTKTFLSAFAVCCIGVLMPEQNKPCNVTKRCDGRKKDGDDGYYTVSASGLFIAGLVLWIVAWWLSWPAWVITLAIVMLVVAFIIFLFRLVFNRSDG